MRELGAEAIQALQLARPQVAAAARVSHVGFRAADRAAWDALLAQGRTLGEVYLTTKADGRAVPFVKLATPLQVGADTLEYLEFPENKATPHAQPAVVVVFAHAESLPAQVQGGVEIRQQPLHAEDYIAAEQKKDRVA